MLPALMRITLILVGGLATLALALLVAAQIWRLPGEYPTPSGELRNSSHYIDMPDGARIAIDIWLPANTQTNAQFPVVLEATRYWRATGLTAIGRVAALFGMALPGIEPGPHEAFFNSKAYAFARLDLRGSGASSGRRESEYSRHEVSDMKYVLDWLITQPWSSGEVFTYGISYSGTLAELTATTGHKALKGVAALYSDFDAQLQLVRPGGLLQHAFLSRWSDMVAAMDRNDLCGVISASENRPVPFMECARYKLFISGVKPVPGEWSALREAVASHRSPDVEKMVRQLEFQDSAWADGTTAAESQVYGRRQEIEAANVPLYIVAGWFDAATANGALARFNTHRNPQETWIVPLSHGGTFDTDPFNPPDTQPTWSQTEQLTRVHDFFQRQLKGAGTETRVLRYAVLGTGSFEMTRSWPPTHMKETFFHFADGHSLTREAPVRTAYDDHQVDFDNGTTVRNRWVTQLEGSDVDYSENAASGLIYTSAPFSEDMVLTGSPIIDLWMTSTRDDGALHAYLESVSPDGKATYLTEGNLRLLHRRISRTPAYPVFGPAHSFLERDAIPMPTGRIERITTTLYATSALIRKGHRLRIRIAGADQTSFERVPVQGDAPRWHVYRGPTKPSSISVPMAPWNKGPSDLRLSGDDGTSR